MERKFPKNVRQIGNVCNQPKIYIEDYVNTYLNQLKSNVEGDVTGALLLGEIVKQSVPDVVYISGAIQIGEIEVSGTEIVINEAEWRILEEKKKEYFPDLEVVGWSLVESGHPMGLNKGVVNVHERIFSKENSIFIWRDALEEDEIVYAYKYNELMQMGGYYIYYEKNPDMQNYMISMRKMIGVTPSEMVEDRAAKNFRTAIKGKMEYKEQWENSRFLYTMSIFLVVVVLAMGISTMNNFDKMEAVQESVEALSAVVGQAETEPAIEEEKEEKEEYSGTMPETSTIQEQLKEKEYYIVEAGDTLDSISRRKYGTTKQVDEICKMNELSDGNLIYIGQKLLLP